MKSITFSCIFAATCLFENGSALAFRDSGNDTDSRATDWRVTPDIVRASVDAMNTAWCVDLQALFSSFSSMRFRKVVPSFCGLAVQALAKPPLRKYSGFGSCSDVGFTPGTTKQTGCVGFTRTRPSFQIDLNTEVELYHCVVVDRKCSTGGL